MSVSVSEHPLYQRYRKVQREIIPALAFRAPAAGVQKWCPAALQSPLEEKDIQYYNMLHLNSPTIEDPDAIFIVFPHPSSPGLCYYGLIIKDPPNHRNRNNYSYFTLERRDGQDNMVVKWIEKSIGGDFKCVAKATMIDANEAKFISCVRSIA